MLTTTSHQTNSIIDVAILGVWALTYVALTRYAAKSRRRRPARRTASDTGTMRVRGSGR